MWEREGREDRGDGGDDGGSGGGELVVLTRKRNSGEKSTTEAALFWSEILLDVGIMVKGAGKS